MFAVFVLGVILCMFGLALVVKGETRVGRRRIHKTSARRFGVFLLCFFPFILIERAVLKQLDPEEELDAFIVHGVVAGLWIVIGLIWFFRIARRPERKRPQPGVATEPGFPASDPIGMPPIPRSASGARRPRQPDNPFDFK